MLQEETVCFGQLLGHSESGEQKKKHLGPFSINLPSIFLMREEEQKGNCPSEILWSDFSF